MKSHTRTRLLHEASRVAGEIRTEGAPGPDTIVGRELAWRREVLTILSVTVRDFDVNDTQWHLIREAAEAFSKRTADAAMTRSAKDAEGLLALAARINTFNPHH